jgi:hypothetical protein
MPHHFEIRMIDQVGDVRPPAGIEVVNAQDIVTVVNQPFTEM